MIKNYKGLYSSPCIINLILVLGVLAKIRFWECLIFEFKKYMWVFWFYLIFAVLTIVLSIIFYYKNKNIFDKEKNKIKIEYLFGKVNIHSKSVDISIKTKDFIPYCFFLFNRKVVFLLIINLCSRISKLKFKTEYKNFFKENQSIKIFVFNLDQFWLIFISFAVSFIIYILFFIVNCFFEDKCKSECCNCIKERECCEKCKVNCKENVFSIFISLENFFIIVLSIVCFFDIGNVDYCWFLAILISGSVNFIFSDFYFNEKINYLLISGFVDITQAIFGILDFLLEPFNDINWYLYLQIIPSFIAMIACIFYCFCNYYEFIKNPFKFIKDHICCFCCKKNNIENNLNNNIKTQNEIPIIKEGIND